MSDRKPFVVPQNNLPLNRAALFWLKEAKAQAPAHNLHFLSLAAWGLENAAEGDWPQSEQAALRQQTDVMFGWPPALSMRWVHSNPNGPQTDEQQINLLNDVQLAQTPKQAAALVLNAIWNRQVAANPALQPAASELS